MPQQNHENTDSKGTERYRISAAVSNKLRINDDNTWVPKLWFTTTSRWLLLAYVIQEITKNLKLLQLRMSVQTAV
jgi:CRISPR/Cas system-associated protein Csx1